MFVFVSVSYGFDDVCARGTFVCAGVIVCGEKASGLPTGNRTTVTADVCISCTHMTAVTVELDGRRPGGGVGSRRRSGCYARDVNAVKRPVTDAGPGDRR